MTDLVLPRMRRADVLDRASRIVRLSDPSDVQCEFGNTAVEEFWWPPVGRRVQAAWLSELGQTIRDLASSFGFPAKLTTPKLQGPVFDAALAHVLRGALQISESEASRPGVWGCLGTAVVPDVVVWRWNDLTSDRAVSDRFWTIRRGALARLWWRQRIFTTGRDDDEALAILKIGEDRLVQVQERPTLFQHRNLAAAYARVVAGRKLEGLAAGGKPLLNKAIVQVRRRLAFTEPALLDDSQLETLWTSAIESVAKSI